jgi:hypothetical protein
MRRIKKGIKFSLKLIIDSNGNPLTMLVTLTKPQVNKLIDHLLPDDEIITKTNNKT